MTSSKISFPTYDPAITNQRNKPDARCNIRHITQEKLALGNKKVKITIIYSVINSDWIGAPGVSINIPSFRGFYRKSWQIHGTEGQIHKTGLSRKNKKILNTQLFFFFRETYASLGNYVCFLHNTSTGKQLPKRKLGVKTSSQPLEYFLQVCAI